MIQKDLILSQNDSKSIVFDVFYAKTEIPKPLVFFCHGYKGFKDWGAWNLLAKYFMEAGCFFVKFNFSHNGGTVDDPIDFPDLDAFAENNYSKELADLDVMMNHILNADDYRNELDPQDITLIGHSRGGGIMTLKAAEDRRVKKLITLAGVSDFGKRFGVFDMESWKRDGVTYVLNGRTKQQMPHNYQFYEDYVANEERLNIEAATKQLEIPHLIIHGTDDPAVSFSEAEALHEWHPESVLYPIDNSDHVFGTKHPWEQEDMSPALNNVVETCIDFIM